MKASKIWSEDTDSVQGQIALLRDKVDGIIMSLWLIIVILIVQLVRHW